MNNICPHANCHAPETTCAIGEPSLDRCEHWQGAAADDAELVKIESIDDALLPWTGNSMGGSDIAFVAARSNAKLVAIIGAESAGKTTLLAAWYLLTSRGRHPYSQRFCGSYSLGGWENIASSLRWSRPSGPTFPAHTSSAAGRRPGLLHLAFRSDASLPTDLLFADTPGEWFSRWAVHRDAPEAEGAKWLVEHADVILLVADSQALAGQSRGVARGKLLEIIQRAGAEHKDRPVALVWTKSDIEVPQALVDAVRLAAARHLPTHVEFHVSLYPPKGLAGSVDIDQGTNLLELLSWLTVAQRSRYIPSIPAPISTDYFVAYGHD